MLSSAIPSHFHFSTLLSSLPLTLLLSLPFPFIPASAPPPQSDRLLTSLIAESESLREEVRQAREQSAESDRQVRTRCHPNVCAAHVQYNTVQYSTVQYSAIQCVWSTASALPTHALSVHLFSCYSLLCSVLSCPVLSCPVLSCPASLPPQQAHLGLERERELLRQTVHTADVMSALVRLHDTLA